jgi:hypothetical protein
VSAMTINPAVKYTLGRVGLFVLVALLLWPVPISLLVKLMLAIVVSFALQFVVLRRWRADMINQVDHVVARRRVEKAQLRAALAGEDEEPDTSRREG